MVEKLSCGENFLAQASVEKSGLHDKEKKIRTNSRLIHVGPNWIYHCFLGMKHMGGQTN